jgi:hypothetical protein
LPAFDVFRSFSSFSFTNSLKFVNIDEYFMRMLKKTLFQQLKEASQTVVFTAKMAFS